MSIPKSIISLEELQTIVQNNPAVLVYFSTTSCNVGEALAPKVFNLVQTYFPKVTIITIDINYSPNITATYSAFVEPTILVFFDGKETVRKSRNIGLNELHDAIKRPYTLIFE